MREMIVGLISDTHDRVELLSAAVALLRDAGAEYILHCGDLISRRALDCFGDMPTGFVWGERDKDRMGMLRYAATLQIQCFGVLGDFPLDDKRVALIHGDDRKMLKKLLDEGQHDFIFHGHSSMPVDEKQGKTHIVSPGAIHGGKDRTVALVDTDTGSVQTLSVTSNEK